MEKFEVNTSSETGQTFVNLLTNGGFKAFFGDEKNKNEVMEVIKTVRRENNISNRENTILKIRKLVANLYRDIKSKLDCYPYKGQHLSDFMSDEWVEKVASVVESEVYHDKGENASREHTNVFAVFDEIKLEFYNNIK